MNNLLLLPPIICLLFSIVPVWAGSVQVYPAPAGEELSKDFGVQVEGKQIPVYVAKVACSEPERRWKAMDDKAHSADYFENASFAYFDMQGTVAVTVSCPEVIQSAKVLPSSWKITPTIEGKRLSLTLSGPKPLTIEVNGDWVRSLHLFANPPEGQAPRITTRRQVRVEFNCSEDAMVRCSTLRAKQKGFHNNSTLTPPPPSPI